MGTVPPALSSFETVIQGLAMAEPSGTSYLWEVIQV